ncbi:hypothetical protein [Methanospirillum lacunae]|uniref:Uncharacterized protein n=1 Tax=Methanospirillum lacunae TaxID=668570 RepID=A0A2V2N385_9EURY|nr:hypothetical protein [Methanospirillum lacunae]PWR73020.1 hypothetical protein DK846_05405 [Methanospirillum lacunae]
MNAINRIILFFLIITLFFTSTTNGAKDQLTWTNANNDTLFNGPDKPTLVTFTSCMKVLSISTHHWNYGQGDTPGKISLVHVDGTLYGPWRAFGVNGSHDEQNVFWSYNPGEIIKAGTYLVGDSNKQTWAQNDVSDNRGIVTIVAETALCPGDAGEKTENISVPIEFTTIPPEMDGAITLSPEEIDPSTLSGGETDTEIVPLIDQVVFRLISGKIHGGDPIYALLRIRNSGFRTLQEGYITIRLISPTGITTYKGGMAKLPNITAGEERDIPLIIPTGKSDSNSSMSTEKSLVCGEYILDGTISEHMEGGKLVRRGDLILPREKMISVTGCCQEPQTTNIMRGC